MSDPQGPAIRGGLHHPGFESVESRRAGKDLELRLDELDGGRARERVDAMCRRLLASPVIKEYRYDLEPAGS